MHASFHVGRSFPEQQQLSNANKHSENANFALDKVSEKAVTNVEKMEVSGIADLNAHWSFAVGNLVIRRLVSAGGVHFFW